ncbi:MAG: single-stranded-DNA-specific exonuclease RecJ [Candidatus Aadella gelida]|nr:single-stranded-DNA-specific exonuclease RecJ [Candidatus Aadella gelida]
MKWKSNGINQRLQGVLSEALGVTPLFAQLLVNRGITTPRDAKTFLFGDLSSCHDPFLMKDMDKAVARIKEAIEKKEKILVYGDYDVDGVTSVALLSETLRVMGAEYETFIPNRMDDGYGLNIQAVKVAKEDKVSLLITVDCGINSYEEVEYAGECGIDVIITDHHVERTEQRPAACAIVDPHQTGCMYPFKNLAGVGVAYKLVCALTDSNAEEHLDLVALGTIADIMPLVEENRILVKNGLKKLRGTEKPGIKALVEVSGVEQEKITCRNIGFALGPRINAMGRIGSADVALDLLICKDRQTAWQLACRLDTENKNRQGIQKNILRQALDKVEKEIDLDEDKVIVLSDDAWHPGIIGIVASKITEEYSRPAILIAFDGENGRGSGRSVKGFNLFDAIGSAENHLVGYGGHKQACGINIKRDNVGLFRESLNKYVSPSREDKDADGEALKIDLRIPLAYIGVKLINELDLLMPYGQGNEEPLFCTSGIRVKTQPRYIGTSGFKFLATCGTQTCEAITFRKNQITKPAKGDVIDLAYAPSINRWAGIDTIQLNIKDLRIVN